MGDPAPLSIPINKPSFNWESHNLHEAFKIFKNQAKYLLIMANTNLVKTKTRLELYSIGLAQSHMVFMMSLNLVQENPRQMFNMYSMHLKLTSSQHSLSSRAGINLVDNTPVHSSLKWTLC